MITEKEILQTLSAVMHPAINHSLMDLGIVKNVKLMDETVGLEFCFPFPNIPIADQLIGSIEKPIQDLGLLCVYKETVMNEEEKARFIQMEVKSWKGL